MSKTISSSDHQVQADVVVLTVVVWVAVVVAVAVVVVLWPGRYVVGPCSYEVVVDTDVVVWVRVSVTVMLVTRVVVVEVTGRLV